MVAIQRLDKKFESICKIYLYQIWVNMFCTAAIDYDLLFKSKLDSNKEKPLQQSYYHEAIAKWGCFFV